MNTLGRSKQAKARENTKKTVYVIAWQYNTGAGFDWYYKEADADKAWQEEKANIIELTDENWTAFRFVHKTTKNKSAITDEIDAQLDNLCEAATVTIGAGFAAINKFVASEE